MYWTVPLAVVLAVAQAGQSSILQARQATTPTLPTGGFGTCGDPCNAWEKIISDCGIDTGTDLLKCYCTQDYVDAMGQCYDCLVPLVQQAGSDPTFAQDAQAAIDDFEQACSEEGFGVSSVTITGGGGGAGPTPSTGAQETPTLVTSPGSSPSATAPGGSATSGGSGTPTGLPGKNAAVNTGAASSMVLAGLFGGVVAFFGL